MGQERWDVVLRALNGPMAHKGEVSFRGPVIRVGASPGSGGVDLSGYRGLDARQAVLTSYDGGTVSIAPVGAAQVRVAPHQNVRWEDLDPIPGPQYLHPGCAVHLGPVGRGATLLFVAVNKLGAWDDSGISSHLSEAATLITGDGPQAQAAPRVNLLKVQSMPVWFVGLFGLLSLMVSAVALLVVLFDPPDVEPLGPQIEGEEYIKFVRLDKAALDRIPRDAQEGLKAGFWRFVMKPNVKISGRTELKTVSEWDERLFQYVGMMAKEVSHYKKFWRRLEMVHKDYAYVVATMRKEGLPEVFAGIPYLESRYKSEIQSYVCGKGYWQFMPEVAHRMEVKHGLDFRVRECTLTGGLSQTYTPTNLAPPISIKNAKYVNNDGGKLTCRIPAKRGCRVDDRTDLVKSTAAAVDALREAYHDPLIKRSGAAVQMAIASHNAGYDDSRFLSNGKKKSYNILPAFKWWTRKNPRKDPSRFIGETISCEAMIPGKSGDQRCGSSPLVAQTQHYTYATIAYHMLAACFYGKNFGDMREFSHYRRMYTADGSYCADLNIPDAGSL